MPVQPLRASRLLPRIFYIDVADLWARFVRPLFCKFLPHRMRFDDGSNAAGPATCTRCGHHEPAVRWPHR